MIVFLDTNIVVDYVARRERFPFAAKLIEMALNEQIRIAISTLTFVNVAYIMRKNTQEEISQKLLWLYRLSIVPPISDVMVLAALQQSPNDFEDFVQYQSAEEAKADIIVTNDRKGFVNTPLPVLTSEEFINHCA